MSLENIGKSPRLSSVFLFFASSLMVVACNAGDSDVSGSCSAAGHCHMEDNTPVCDLGYVWVEPEDSTNLNCVLAPGIPIIASFSVRPSSVLKGSPSSVTWHWTYTNTPSSIVSCNVAGIGAINNGSTSNISIDEATIFTLTCSNSIGSHSSQATVSVVDQAVAPIIGSFTSSPGSAVIGVPTSTVWNWTYANTPTPTPTCTVDQGVGATSSGSTTSITLSQDTVYSLTCGNAGGSDEVETTIRAVVAPVAPVVTSFSATPSVVTTGLPTNVGWQWTYATPPTPTPTCVVDQGVGPVSQQTTTSLTLSTPTEYTLQCTNSAGSDEAMTVVDIVAAPDAPIIASFSATPDAVLSGTATNVKWDWNFANTPTPTPSCTVDQGVGSILNSSVTSITIAEETTYSITCVNAGGSATADTIVGTTSAYVGDGWEIVADHNRPPFTLIYGLEEDDLWGVYGFSIWHWEGNRWKEESSNQVIHSMWGTDANNIYAVGRIGISHWNGSSWSVPIEPGSNVQEWHDICGRSSDDIWALGYDGDEQIVAHFDGGIWTIVPGPPDEFTGGTSLRHSIACRDDELWVSNRSNTYILRQGFWLKYQGAVDWFWDFWVSPTNELFAITQGKAYRFVDSVFMEEATGEFRNIWGLASDDVYVSGNDGTLLHRGSDGSWSDVAPDESSDFRAVYGLSTDTVWLSEKERYPSFRSLWYGGYTNWDVHDNIPLGYFALLDGYASNDIWSAASDGSVFHYDGIRWTPSLNSESIRSSVFACGPNEVWGAMSGVNEVAHYTTSAGWQTISTGLAGNSDDEMTAIWGSSCDDVWFFGVVDGVTLILHWDGMSFTRDSFFSFDNEAVVRKLFGLSSTDIWGVTSHGVIHYDGSYWSSDAEFDVNGIWGTDADNMWSIGTAAIFQNDGLGWSLSDSPMLDPILADDYKFAGIFGIAADDIWIVGRHDEYQGELVGRSWHYDGVVWAEAPPIPSGAGANRWIHTVWGSSDGYWALGSHGLMLYHAPF